MLCITLCITLVQEGQKFSSLLIKGGCDISIQHSIHFFHSCRICASGHLHLWTFQVSPGWDFLFKSFKWPNANAKKKKKKTTLDGNPILGVYFKLISSVA